MASSSSSFTTVSAASPDCFKFNLVIKRETCLLWSFIIFILFYFYFSFVEHKELAYYCATLKSQCHPKCFARLCFCFEAAFSLAGAFVGLFANYTVPHWPFSELICTVVASENRNIFIARCY